MANKMTRGMWFNPIVIDDEPAVKQEIPFAPGPVLTPGPVPTPGPVLTPGPITAYPPVRFGTMRTRNQLCRLLQEAYNTSPEEFHQKIDRAYAQFLYKFSTTQEAFLTRMQPVFNNGNCFFGVSQVFPSATLTQLMQMVLHGEQRQTWALFHCMKSISRFSGMLRLVRSAKGSASWSTTPGTSSRACSPVRLRSIDAIGDDVLTRTTSHLSLIQQTCHGKLVSTKQQGTSVQTSE